MIWLKPNEPFDPRMFGNISLWNTNEVAPEHHLRDAAPEVQAPWSGSPGGPVLHRKSPFNSLFVGEKP